MSNNELSHGIVTVNHKFMAKVCKKTVKYKTVILMTFVKFLLKNMKKLYETKNTSILKLFQGTLA